MNKNLLVTGSLGLISSEGCTYCALPGSCVYGEDNNGQAVFLSPQGDTRWNQQRLQKQITGFQHHAVVYQLRPEDRTHS